MDIAKGEAAEAENSAFIERRHNQRIRDEGERLEEEAWMVSERLNNARRLRENTAAWYGYLMNSADSIERTAAEIAATKRAQAARLMEETDKKGRVA